MSHSKRANDSVNGAIALYDPNGAAAIIFFLAFAAVAVGHWIRYFKSGKPRPKYMLPVVLGCSFMSIGYICRFSRRNGINAWSWLFETFCILLSPCAFLAEIDMILPRLASEINAESSIAINVQVFKITFILMDVVCVLAQLAGTALTITFGKLVPIGHMLVTAALWVQLGFFLLTLAVYIIFGLRVRRDQGWQSLHSYPTLSSYTTLYIAIGASCICMLIRSCYRVAEYTAGGDSDLAHNEVAFYLLDSVPMLLFTLIFVVVWTPSVFESGLGGSRGVLNTSERLQSVSHVRK